MKTALTILLALGWVGSCLGQGQVDFRNNVLFVTTADRLVRAPGGMPLANTDFVAQLYYGVDASSLQPVAAAPARFLDGTTAVPGTWLGGAARTLLGFSSGSTATLQVRVWDSSLYPTFEQAVTASGVYGQSLPFLYTVPEPLSPPQSYYMENFRGFQLVPEPSGLTLLLIGAAVVWLRRRRGTET